MTGALGWRSHRPARGHRAWRLFLVLVGILLACLGQIREEPMEVASLNLACHPVSRGAECHLLALFRNGTLPARDVTGWASWRAAGIAEMHLTPEGAVQLSGRGDVVIDTRFQSCTARTLVRLTPDQPAQLLATVRGAVYVSDRGRLTPMANARVEVVSGSSVGPQTTTHDDGSYELTPVVPGQLVIHSTKRGFVGTDLPVHIQPGDNRVSVVLFVEPRTEDLTL
jgi:hypothetical protein